MKGLGALKAKRGGGKYPFAEKKRFPAKTGGLESLLPNPSPKTGGLVVIVPALKISGQGDIPSFCLLEFRVSFRQSVFVSSAKHRHFEKTVKSSGKCFIYGE